MKIFFNHRTVVVCFALCLNACVQTPISTSDTGREKSYTFAQPRNPYASLPSDVLTHCQQVYIEYSQQHFAKVADLARECLSYNDLPVEIRSAQEQILATADVSLNQYVEAIDAENRSIELTPKPSDGQLLILANAYRGAHRYEESLATFDRLYTEHETMHDSTTALGMPYYFNRGSTLAEMGRWHDAIQAFTLGIPYQPAFPAVYLKRAQAREAIGDVADARDDYVEFARWATTRGVDASTRAKLASLNVDREAEHRRPFGDRNPLRDEWACHLLQAQQALQSATTPDARAAAFSTISDSLDSLERSEEALTAINQAIKLTPDSILYLQSKVTTLLSLNRPHDAIAFGAPLRKRAHEEADAAASSGPVYGKYVEASGSSAFAYMELGDWDQAIDAFADTARGSGPSDQDYLATYYLYVRARGGDHAHANELFDNVIRHATQPIFGNYRRSLLLYWQGQATLDQVEEQISMIRDDVARQNALAETLYLAGAYLKYVKHDVAGTSECLLRINALAPYGTTDWMLAKRDLTPG